MPRGLLFAGDRVTPTVAKTDAGQGCVLKSWDLRFFAVVGAFVGCVMRARHPFPVFGRRLTADAADTALDIEAVKRCELPLAASGRAVRIEIRRRNKEQRVPARRCVLICNEQVNASVGEVRNKQQSQVLELRKTAGLPWSRRALLQLGNGCAAAWLLPAASAFARTPGSEDPVEAVEQIRDASLALKKLRNEWTTYAVIDAEGRAGNIDAARKILGGVGPQRGEAAIAVAKATPLYRVDGAFAAVRKAALDAEDGSWPAEIDVENLVELGEKIAFDLQKADNDFYGVVFASKGTAQLAKIYEEAGACVDRSIANFEEVLTILRKAKAPGV